MQDLHKILKLIRNESTKGYNPTLGYINNDFVILERLNLLTPKYKNQWKRLQQWFKIYASRS